MIRAVALPMQWSPPAAWKRGVLAGIAWGAAMGVGLPVLSFLNCGVICLSDVAFTTALSVAVGVAAFGPLAAFSRRKS